LYIPQSFKVPDISRLHGYIHRWPFATLVSVSPDAAMEITHLPLLLDETSGPFGTLVGHFARANAHSKAVEERWPTTAIFHGPHAYISASWYEHPERSVPTWNYAVIHAGGILEPLPEGQPLLDHVQQLAAVFEGASPGWELAQLSEDHAAGLLKAVTGFRLPVADLHGKFKLGQNRSNTDLHSIVHNLQQRGKGDDLKLAELTRQALERDEI
jgi:transcriptional regulator